jgi:APA family basic amino acid/polyamine antiporter
VFSTPIWWLVAPGAILGCLYLFYSLSAATQRYFLIAHCIGAVIYLLYGVRKSVLAQAEKA